MFDVVAKLLDVEADVVVTITASLNRRRPGNDADRIRLRNLVADAKSQVLAARDPTQREPTESIVSRLSDAEASVDLAGGADGFVIVVSDGMTEVHLLPFPVQEVVSVGTTPATRLLVQGLRRSPRYRVLVVSDKATRLFEAVRHDVREVTEQGFPFAADVVPRDLRAIAGRFARVPDGDDKEQWRNFYRQVDAGLSDVGRTDPLPLVVAGVDRSLDMFEKVSDNTHLTIGRISGAHEEATAHDLGQLSWPIVQGYLEERRSAAVAELNSAYHDDIAVVGIDDAWELSRQGRGRRVIVEEDYHAEPAREVDHRLVPADGPGPDVLADPVDELIEHVLRAGGTAEFVAPGALADLGRIGLLLR